MAFPTTRSHPYEVPRNGHRPAVANLAPIEEDAEEEGTVVSCSESDSSPRDAAVGYSRRELADMILHVHNVSYVPAVTPHVATQIGLFLGMHLWDSRWCDSVGSQVDLLERPDLRDVKRERWSLQGWIIQGVVP